MNNETFRQQLHDRVTWTDRTTMACLKHWAPWLRELLSNTDDEPIKVNGHMLTVALPFGDVRAFRQSDSSSRAGEVLVLTVTDVVPVDPRAAMIDCMLTPSLVLDVNAESVSYKGRNLDDVGRGLSALNRFIQTHYNTETAP